MSKSSMATPEELLNDAIDAMAELHRSMTPDDLYENMLVPPAALRRFVDAHARLMYERARLTHNATVIGSLES